MTNAFIDTLKSDVESRRRRSKNRKGKKEEKEKCEARLRGELPR